MTERQGPRVVTEGQQIADMTVGPKCSSPYDGYWFCVAHGPLRNNLEMEGHTEPKCQVAWFCFGHNVLEVP